MTMNSRNRLRKAFAAVAMLCTANLLVPSVLLGADKNDAKNIRAPQPGARTVDLFAAIDAKEIDVKFIPKDATQARLLVKNNTKQPLNVRMPEAYSAMPVLAQLGGGGGNRGGGGANNQNQSMGGGGMMGGGMMGGGMGGGGMGGGMFNVAPEQLGQFKLATVCLEHGKKDPKPNIPYEIRPLENFTAKPAVRELLVNFSKGQLSQRAAQAAAWHLENGLSWEQLANKRIEHLDGSSEMWFAPHEIRQGMQASQAAVAAASEKSERSPGETVSLNVESK